MQVRRTGHTAAHSAFDRFGKGPADTIGPGRRYQREVFRNLHSLLGHATNVADLLWPPDDVDGVHLPHEPDRRTQR